MHQHHHGLEESDSTRNLAVAFWLNFGFTLIEIVGGLYTNSLAIVSDAIHDLGDSLSLGLAWYFQKLSRRGSDAKFTYGYRRFSVLGALINTTVLSISSIIIIYRAVLRILEPEPVVAGGMILLAIGGIIVNGIAAMRLRHGDSLNQKVVALHLLEDVLGWAAVLVGGICMYFFDLPWIDPVLSLLIAGFILYNALKSLRATLQIFLQRTPPGIDLLEVRAKLEAIPGVLDAHDIHVWSLDGRYVVMTAHVQVPGEKSMNEMEKIKHNAQHDLHDLGIHHVTLEFESPRADCHDCGATEAAQ